MKVLAAWVLAKRSNALVSTSGFAAIAMVFPPLLLLSLASLGLVSMRRGAKEGLLIVLGSAAFLTVLSLVASQGVTPDIVIFSVLWLMTWGLALVYRQYAATAWMINAAGVIGVVLVAGFYLLIGEPADFWLGLLNQHLRPIFIEAQLVPNTADLDKLISGLSQVLTGGMAALVSVLLISSLLVARWWQAMLFNPGGFRQDFHSLRLSKITALVMLVLLAVSLLGDFSLTADIATVVWLLFFFQGMAVIHSLVAQVGMGVTWLVSIYVLLTIMPYYASPVLSGLGFVDTWFDFRGRFRKKVKPNENDDFND